MFKTVTLCENCFGTKNSYPTELGSVGALQYHCPQHITLDFDESIDQKDTVDRYTYSFLVIHFQSTQWIEFPWQLPPWSVLATVQLLSQQFGIHAAQMLWLKPSSISLNLAGTIWRELILPFLTFFTSCMTFLQKVMTFKLLCDTMIKHFQTVCLDSTTSPLNMENWEHTALYADAIIYHLKLVQLWEIICVWNGVKLTDSKPHTQQVQIDWSINSHPL